jgi:hypothetical protein
MRPSPAADGGQGRKKENAMNMRELKRHVNTELNGANFHSDPVSGVTSLYMRRDPILLVLTDQGHGELDWTVYRQTGPIREDHSLTGTQENATPLFVARITPGAGHDCIAERTIAVGSVREVVANLITAAEEAVANPPPETQES